MDSYLLIAGILAILLGLAHSILGERLIFAKKRAKGRLIPSLKSPGLAEAHLRIIWASWHLVSVFGWCLGAFLLVYGINGEFSRSFVLLSIALSMLLGALLVGIGTQGKHPGWIVLLLIGGLLLLTNFLP